MKKIVTFTSLLALYCLFGAKKVSAWSGVTHEDIVSKALALLEKENKCKTVAFYKEYTAELLKGCTQPDSRGDVDKGSGLHYYSCVNPDGKQLADAGGYYRNRLKKISRSARTLMEENYTGAVSLYKSGDRKNAMRVFGRAVHFLSDMGCTVHVSNMKFSIKPKNIHHAFEKRIATTGSKFSAEKFDKRLLKCYDSNSFETATNKLVRTASKYVDIIKSLDPRDFDHTAEEMLPIIQQNVMALMLKFYNDCQCDNENYILDQKLYSFKNLASGMMITAGEKGISLAKPDKKTEQCFKISLLSNGNFSLKTKDGQFVSKKFSLTSSGKPQIFRVSAMGSRQFRVTSDVDGYTKVLACTRQGKLAFTEFEPNNPAQIWVIK